MAPHWLCRVEFVDDGGDMDGANHRSRVRAGHQTTGRCRADGVQGCERQSMGTSTPNVYYDTNLTCPLIPTSPVNIAKFAWNVVIYLPNPGTSAICSVHRDSSTTIYGGSVYAANGNINGIIPFGGVGRRAPSIQVRPRSLRCRSKTMRRVCPFNLAIQPMLRVWKSSS